MTKYDAYCSAKPVIEQVCRSINKALGRTEVGERDKFNDKASFKFKLDSKSLELGYGFYGSSSYYRCDDAESITYIQKACNELSTLIGAHAIELAQKDLELKRIAAVDEAHQVFYNCTQPSSKEA